MSTFGIIGTILGITCLIVIVCISIYNKGTRFNRGSVGENRVADKLLKYINQKGGYLINDVIIPGKNNRTSQIDHILFTLYGIFVIETKNTSGRVYGKDGQEYWTQVLAYGDVKNKLYNPVMQNQTHVDRLQRILSVTDIYNIVVFNQNNTRYIESSKVLTKRELLDYLIDHSQKEIYSRDEIESFYKKIKYYVDNPIISHEEHARRIHERYKNNN